MKGRGCHASQREAGGPARRRPLTPAEPQWPACIQGKRFHQTPPFEFRGILSLLIASEHSPPPPHPHSTHTPSTASSFYSRTPRCLRGRCCLSERRKLESNSTRTRLRPPSLHPHHPACPHAVCRSGRQRSEVVVGGGGAYTSTAASHNSIPCTVQPRSFPALLNQLHRVVEADPLTRPRNSYCFPVASHRLGENTWPEDGWVGCCFFSLFSSHCLSLFLLFSLLYVTELR